MNALKNSVRLIGKVASDPQIREATSEQKHAYYMMTTSESYKNNKGDRITDMQWHCIVAYGKLAEIVEGRISKGTEIAIEGKLCTRCFINKNGFKVYKTEIQIRELLILEQISRPAQVTGD